MSTQRVKSGNTHNFFFFANVTIRHGGVREAGGLPTLLKAS
jgi:hypothetical protein